MPFERIRPARYHGATKQERLDWLRRRVARCENCPNLVKTRRKTVFGEGSLDAFVMLVGEAPGEDEDYFGRPFIGRAGKLLRQSLQDADISLDDVYITNVLKCRPDPPLGQANRPPTKPEMDDCLPYLLAQIEVVDPPVIVALGATAISALGSTSTISEARGTNWVFRRKWDVVATYHPAFILRSPSYKTEFLEDLEEAARIAGV